MKRALTATVLALLAIAVGVATTSATHLSIDHKGDVHIRPFGGDDGNLEVDGKVTSVGSINVFRTGTGTRRFFAGTDIANSVSWGNDGADNFMIWDSSSSNSFQVRPTELVAWHLLRPVSNNTYLLGTNGARWKWVMANNVDIDDQLLVDGNVTMGAHAIVSGDVILEDSMASTNARITTNPDSGDLVVQLGAP